MIAVELENLKSKDVEFNQNDQEQELKCEGCSEGVSIPIWVRQGAKWMYRRFCKSCLRKASHIY